MFINSPLVPESVVAVDYLQILEELQRVQVGLLNDETGNFGDGREDFIQLLVHFLVWTERGGREGETNNYESLTINSAAASIN